VIIEGEVVLGDGVRIGPFTLVRDATVGAGSVIHSHCVIEQGTIGARCDIGPYARVRPEVQLADGAKLGNFVEIKKSVIGAGSKVNHLSYIGDAVIGSKVNVGAGTITCNYDGANKHRTLIGDGAFIGSGVELVATGRESASAPRSVRARPSPSRPLRTSSHSSAPGRPPFQNWKRPLKKRLSGAPSVGAA
jgi:bifunctional UDP-N-acetylglucosamine pyrophosphorylase/glucosamine-1-phosphate N-acetyltransferase